jgi:hypothetical protein
MDSLRITEKEALARLRSMRGKKGKSKPRKQRFKVQFVMLPLRWIEALRRSKNVSTYHLAFVILLEAFRCEQSPFEGQIVLSSHVTQMKRSTRARAVTELVGLAWISTDRN